MLRHMHYLCHKAVYMLDISSKRRSGISIQAGPRLYFTAQHSSLKLVHIHYRHNTLVIQLGILPAEI